MASKTQHRQQLERLKTELLSGLQGLAADDQRSSWLKTLYETRTDRFNSENEKIWTTGRIFVPVAIAAFGAYAALRDPDLSQALTLAALSVGLLFIWELIAQVHRQFQEIHECWLNAIEQLLSIKPGETAIPKYRVSLRGVRWLLIAIVFFAWTLIIVFRHILPLK